MCGIVGVIGSKKAASIIVDGLKKLEYRGYDSAGLAVITSGKFKTVKEEGKIARLESALKKEKIQSEIGIGHTRWATHGRQSKQNAHPHASSKVCLVHNGIIENYQELRDKLKRSGVKFLSETDSEVVPHLIEQNYQKTDDIKKSLISSVKEIHGTFALALMFKDNPDVIAVAKRGSPLVIGIGEDENFIASDYYALAAYTNQIMVLEDDEIALVSAKEVKIYNLSGREVRREIREMEPDNNKVSKDGYSHFMLKEIHEQPRVLEETIQTYTSLGTGDIHLPNFSFDLSEINKITIVACGTSYYSGLAAKYLIEEIAGVEVEVDIASEFRYRSHPFRKDNLMIFVSQSGETADTLAALKYAKENRQKIMSVVNVAHSSMAQLSDVVIRTVAGPEIGVASTKAYTAQISVMSLLAIHIGFLRGKVSPKQKSKLLLDLAGCGEKISEILEQSNIRNLKKVAKSLVNAKHMLYIGRGVSQVTAFEAALKMRELSYIDAQAIAAGELKHGTIALIDKKMPVIAIAPSNSLFEKQAITKEQLQNIEYIDLRFGNKVFYKNKTN